ncbi:Hypothetical predicted protein [Cloeon dipterum]|uniref:F-box domain-containing protein n=1 Tax=Cloeon dipterum TaxID=197152 RepID=A0A8S1D8E0_9INSE|nr:Hypothetical predicted protein [Cloeon dipterum]
MQLEAEAANRVRAIACGFGTELPADFELNQLFNLPIELVQKIVVKLMETRCNSLRREAMEVPVLMMPSLRLYLAMRPTKVDLTAFLSFIVKRLKYKYFKQTVILISEKAAEIEELSLLVATRERICIYDIADAELLQALAKLKRLKVLRIEEICAINFINLIGLCQHLPDLEFLHCNIAPDDIFDRIDFTEPIIAEELEKAMPKLKVFLFNASPNQERARNALTKVCADNLLNLHVVQAFSSEFSSSADYESTNEITRASGNSNLRHLRVKYDSVESFTRLPLAHPLITHLKIDWSTSAANEADKLTALLQLTHLESLEFTNVPQKIFLLFVEKFGANLLAISCYNCVITDYSLGQLLALCPKLERLAFRAYFKVDLEPIAFFSNLKEIRIILRRVYYNQSIRLTDILRAPDLEKLTFTECNFDDEDLRSVSTLIREKKILQKLKELHFSIFASAGSFNADGSTLWHRIFVSNCRVCIREQSFADGTRRVALIVNTQETEPLSSTLAAFLLSLRFLRFCSTVR